MNRIEIIKQELEKPEYLDLMEKQDYPALANMLNQKSTISNPEPQVQIPKPITTIDLWQRITPQEGLEIYKISKLKADIDAAIASNNRTSLAALFAITSQLISQTSKEKIESLLAETIPDPNYKSEIEGESIAEKLGLELVREDEIQSALNP